MRKGKSIFQKYSIDFKAIRDIDKVLLISTILLTLFGLLNIYLCTKGSLSTTGPFDLLKRQAQWFFVSMIALYIFLVIDYTKIYRYVSIFYFGCIVLLTTVWIPGLGQLVNGARGWIKLGGFQMQPAEVAKFGIILMVAKLLDEMDWEINKFKNFAKIAVYVLVPMALILAEKDMGMTMVCFFIVLGMVFVAGLDTRVIGGGIIAIFVAVLLLWNTGIIQPHQKARLVAFISTDTQETTQGYQLNESMVGIGAGGILGIEKSLNPEVSPGYAGTHVPEIQTDFIFCAIGEQFGFIGCIFVLGLYSIMIIRMVMIARRTKDRFGSLICVGIISYFIFAITQNIGMTIGLMPITGITLPLLSYGGSSLLTTTMTIALVLNIGMRKVKIRF